MKLKRALAAAALVVGATAVPLAATAAPAAAATPGSPCTIRLISGANAINIPGTVISVVAGYYCKPLPALTGELAILNAGLPCGMNTIFPLLNAYVVVSCPE